MVGYLEEPGVWHQIPEEDQAKAIAWPRRIRGAYFAARNFFKKFSTALASPSS